ncbi:YcxB family protein [Planococcus sp. CAU13]|uniref:YcxB family protein n=1 Tax=Planococcus sp. CAU13 TaxID=1541197 RepID=UPI00052FDBEC|nr:YcxB family protein [Planococcus sp. CAU13]
MELNYKLTEEDYIGFNLFHAKNSKAIKKQITLQRILVPVMYIVLAILAAYFLDVPFLVLFIPLLAVAILWFLFYPAYFYRLIKRNATKMIREGKNDALLGQHTMIFTEHGLREISPKGEMSLSWSGIENYGEDDSGFYLYNSGMSALIIPKRELRDTEGVGSFLAEKIRL